MLQATANFGSLPKDRGIAEEVSPAPTWRGEVVRYEQERVPQSEYHTLLEAENEPNAMDLSDSPPETKVRFWSDYSRVFFDPKSIQPVPDTAENIEGDWTANQELFRQYDKDVELMEGPMRLTIEECDNFQGVQMMHDTATFGGFSHAMLRSFREEHPKTSIMTFALLSEDMPNMTQIGNVPHTRRIINDSFCLQSLYELCDLAVPILAPQYWKRPAGMPTLYTEPKSIYQTSGILSAIAESATLPLRLRGGLHDLHSYIGHLKWARSPPFAQLSGSLLPGGRVAKADVDDAIQLSSHSEESCTPYARRDVSRGFSEQDLNLYESWIGTSELKHPLLLSHHAPSYPIQTSFPGIFPDSRPKSITLFSSIMTSPSAAVFLSQYATFVQDAVRRKDAALMGMGLEHDDVKELANTLWEVVDSYDDILKEEDEGMGLGEDEE
ncbi:tubulin domain-containing protein [Pisolithus marmoratus]|nr:tubulin domain-containing protein [Pisolithus marmoratus]